MVKKPQKSMPRKNRCATDISFKASGHRDPRKALEPENAQLALLRGAHHVLNLLVPYLEQGQRMHLLQLVGAYNNVDK